MTQRTATVLVVDDEPNNRKLLETLLQADGYLTTTAATGELALASVLEHCPDLILLDVMMPGMDGYEVASILKSDAATASIPIIMVSALDDRGARVSGLQAGAEEFLTKPVDKGELWLRVRNLLRLKELSDRLQGHTSALELQVQERTADLHQLAHYDALTCLPNRAFLYETLRKTLQVAAAKRLSVAVLFVDIDHFKTVNDTLGHAVGDDLLTQVSVRMLESVRVRDTVGRLGGDEFAIIVLLEAGERDGAAVVATKVQEALRGTFHLAGADIEVSASTGIAVFPDDGTDAEALLRSADAAMYRAKESGRDQFRFFTPTMNEDANRRLQVEVAARRRAESNDALAIGLLDDMEAPTCALDENGTITALNRAWRDVTSAEDAVPVGVGIGASYLDVFGGECGPDHEGLVIGVQQVLSRTSSRFELIYSRGGPGEQRWYQLVAFPLPDGTGGVVSHLDVTSDRRASEHLAQTETHDQLTGLPNRSRLLALLTRSIEDGDLHATACIGVDRLKRINDSFGFATGDELLRAIAARAKQHLRHGETLARFAGDEFIAVRPQVSSMDEAVELADRLAAVFTEPFVLGAGSVAVSASVGVALGSSPQSAETLLLAATAAMRDAKRRGPGRISVHTAELAQATTSRITIEAEMRAGMARDEFVLHYQPIVDLQRLEVIGVEALVRWNHPTGLRMPDQFIPVAEGSGLIVPLGARILEQACHQAAAWSAAGLDLTVAVNLSVRQVADPGLLSLVESALGRAQLAPDRLLLEITESAVIEDAELALATLVGIDALGVGIAIDDFGTGYSSLLYLKRYPIHTLKIDRAFVAGMGVNADDDAIVASIVGLGQAVSATCTAEGVETLAQAEALRALGCHAAQGYLFARPLPAAALPAAVQDCQTRMQRRPLVARAPRARNAVGPAAALRAQELRRQGASHHTIAAALNAEGSRGQGGVRWSGTSVGRLLTGDLRPNQLQERVGS